MKEAAVEIPPYWITDWEKVNAYLVTKGRKGKVRIAGKSAGGRDIYIYEYG